MNRRSFLKILAGTAAASTTAYFLPPIGGWKSDVIAHAPYHYFDCSVFGDFTPLLKPIRFKIPIEYSQLAVIMSQGNFCNG